MRATVGEGMMVGEMIQEREARGDLFLWLFVSSHRFALFPLQT